MKQPSLFDLAGDRTEAAGSEDPALHSERATEPLPPDQPARSVATEPGNDVVLEASAGTGKTRVLVDRYVKLIEQDVDPVNILAITFTRKAAAEMRERVLATLRARHATGHISAEKWRALADRVSDIQISTIDAFCFGLLREFPLEAGVEPGFDIADETESGRFTREATDLAFRAARGLIADDESLRLLFARIRLPALSRAVGELLDRRHIALPAVASFVKRRAGAASATGAAEQFIAALRSIVERSPHRRALLDHGPHGAAEFRWLHADLQGLGTWSIPADLPRLQQLRRRVERYFLTKGGDPRKKIDSKFKVDQFATSAARKTHDEAVVALAPEFDAALSQLETGIDAVLARGFLRLLHIAASKYEGLLEEHALLDFAGMLDSSVRLLARQEEFARSRLKLQARHHHILVDEFQDTSRLQWRLIELLIDAWAEGEGASDTPTSIFIVGDRKQSIYRFRHAEVTLLDEAARKISALRPERPVRQAITTNFRSVPELLTFVNALSESIASHAGIDEEFTYTDRDRFAVPAVAEGALRDGEPVLGLIAEPSMALCADGVATEVERLLRHATVRTREGARDVRPEDIAILFRAKAGHSFFEDALEARGIRTYVYKGLGFFDAPEVQDLQALMRFLAQPTSNLRAAEFLRSRFVRMSDPGLVRLAPNLADALIGAEIPAAATALEATDLALLERGRAAVRRWLDQADRVPPGELVDAVMRESAYAFEIRGRRIDQSRENIKKVRALVRRVESRGYATLGRIAEYFDTLRTTDESNAILDASGSVQLMTMHAAKGLEFPIVFLVNLQMGGRGGAGGIRVIERSVDQEPELAFNSTEGTALEDARDTEELRRLLYVGVTRAKDRLYLAAELDQRGQIRKGARSLASLLPSTLLNTFAQAAAQPDADRVNWDSAAGRFTFQVYRPGPPAPAFAPPPEDASDLDVAWLTAGANGAPGLPARGVTTTDGAPGLQTRSARGPEPPGSIDAAILGTLVHRLFQRALPADLSEEDLATRARDLLRTEELVDVDDAQGLAVRAAALYRALRGRPDVTSLLASADVLYEVPFSLVESPGAAARRGVIDCLVLPPDGPPIVLEFKTGGPRPEHSVQVEQYARAIRQILAVNHVEKKILYA